MVESGRSVSTKTIIAIFFLSISEARLAERLSRSIESRSRYSG